MKGQNSVSLCDGLTKSLEERKGKKQTSSKERTFGWNDKYGLGQSPSGIEQLLKVLEDYG